MGVLAYVGGVLTSFGGATTEIATKDADSQDVLERVLLELRVNNELLKLGLDIEIDLDELRNDLMGS